MIRTPATGRASARRTRGDVLPVTCDQDLGTITTITTMTVGYANATGARGQVRRPAHR
ncbi:MAG TPA: hypothetical protein VIR33_11270 [Thermopolyspora sp.]